jgi:hypothetical protein
MPYDVAAHLQPINFFQNMAAGQQERQTNALANQEMGMRQQNLTLQQDQFKAQQQKAQQEETKQWVVNGALHLASAKSPQEFSALADQYAADPRARALGITRDQITPQSVSQILMAAGAAPQKPNLQTLSPGQSVYDMNNPQAPLASLPDKPQAEPAGVQEYNFAKSQGFPGSYLDFKRQSSASTTELKPVLVDVQLPDGSVQKQWVVPGQAGGTGVGVPVSAGATGKVSDTERSASGYLERMQKAEPLIGQYSPSTKDYIGFSKVMGGGAITSAAGNAIISHEGQKYYQAASDWVRAKLRKESGAVIGPQEMAQEIRTYFPMPGDSAEVVQQKQRSRATATDAMRQMAGNAGSSGKGKRVKVDAEGNVIGN